jgi:type III secretion protein U
VSGERSLPPTPQRLAEARAEGRVAVSPILSAAGAIGGATLALGGVETHFAQGLAVAMVAGRDPGAIAWATLTTLAWTLLPVVAAAAAGAILVGLAQTGFLFAPKALGFRAGEISLAELGGRLLMTIVALAVAALVFRELLRAPPSDPRALLPGIALLLGGFGLADWARRRHGLHAALRMTREEVDEERRQAEGDPTRRRARRRRHRELLLSPLAGASAVVVDGEHAVVLRGDKVLDRFAGFAARRVVEGARGAAVTIVYDPARCARLLSDRRAI